MPEPDLQAYGLAPQYAASASDTLAPGRVVSQSRERYRVLCTRGEVSATVSGRLRHAAADAIDFPAVGDFVLLRGAADGAGVIEEILPRKSAFIRKAAGSARQAQVVAANIDTLFICMSLNANFNLRRLERYVTIGYESGALPVVVLTKADLCADVDGLRAQAQSVCPGTAVLVCSALASDGYAQLLPYLRPKQTVAFLGSSGVGKSTLINRLLGEERLSTGELSGDDRGRHTTTVRELLLLPGGAMVIDTPGMRELGLWQAEAGVEKTFADVEALFAECRFPNCSHTREPGCAVRAALQRGELEEARWLSYCKLQQEAAYGEDKESYLSEKEKRFKAIAKINKANKR